MTDTWYPLKETWILNKEKLCHWLRPLREPIKTSRSKIRQKKNLSVCLTSWRISLRATLKNWNLEQRKSVHCPLSYLNYILQMNAFLSLNPLSFKLAQSCSAMPRVVRSLSTSEEGNCREIVSFPHPPCLTPSLLIKSQKSFVRSRGAKMHQSWNFKKKTSFVFKDNMLLRTTV